MSALHRLKAYFGMVPAEEFDDYGPDYRDEYDPAYDGGYGGAGHPAGGYGHPGHPGHPAHPGNGYPGGYGADRGTAAREPAYAGDRSSAPWPRRADTDGYGGDAGRPAPPPPIRSTRHAGWPEPAVHGSLAVDTTPAQREPVTQPRSNLFGDDEAHPLGRIVTLHPRSYHEARPIGERYREGAPVIMNLTGMEDRDARRLVDFAAGLAFALHGSIDKVTNKVFLLSPPNVEVSAEDRRRIAEGGLFNQR